jgi:DNA-3-methyladenine glycosylase II
VLEKHDFPELERKDVFTSLLRAIVGQQLSGKAAQTIWNRFLVLMGPENSNGKCIPGSVLKFEVEELRTVGLSQRKAEYVRGVAEYFIEKGLADDSVFDSLSDEEILKMLTSIRGVGNWTVHMLLMFSLQRFDVLPIDDLGIKKGAVKFFKLSGMPKKNNELEEHFAPFAPYRTFAAFFMWRVADTTLVV